MGRGLLRRRWGFEREYVLVFAAKSAGIAQGKGRGHGPRNHKSAK